jgi:hypothetical protein
MSGFLRVCTPAIPRGKTIVLNRRIRVASALTPAGQGRQRQFDATGALWLQAGMGSPWLGTTRRKDRQDPHPP